MSVQGTPEASGSSESSLYAVGIVHYRSYADLDTCLASVAAQLLPASFVGVVDVEGRADDREGLRTRYPAVDWQEVENRGFAAGANRALEAIAQHAPEARFALILNADTELEPVFTRELIREMILRPDAALGGGKLLRREAGLLDSAGIALPLHRRPRDRGSEEVDRGQFDEVEYVFGVSGAAMLVRRDALSRLRVDDEIFDEDFFLYHEDTDLAWRARNLGMRSLYVPSARAVHQRGWKRAGRFDMPEDVRRHSFKNHYLQIVKNERGRDFLLNLPVVLGWEILRLGFVLLRDRAMLAGYRDALRLAPRAWQKRQRINQKRRERRRSMP